MATEKRLIWGDIAESQLKKLADHYHGSFSGDAFERAMQLIAELPSVDAVELPCKIGDKVYRIDKGNYYSCYKPFIQELTVTEISWKKEKYGDKDLGFAIIADGIRYKFTSIGKSVFLARKDAEEKMYGERKDNG